MKSAQQMNGPYAEGRGDQYREMIDALDRLSEKYKGVRGELLARVKAEMGKLAPNAEGAAKAEAVAPAPEKAKLNVVKPPPPSPAVAQPVAVAAPPPSPKSPPVQKAPLLSPATQNMAPSCRVCGRGMKPAETGGYVCQNGHTR